MIINYEVLKTQINNAIQNSGLDIGAAYFIVKDIYNNIEKLYYAQLNKEAMENSKTEEVSLGGESNSRKEDETTLQERLDV